MPFGVYVWHFHGTGRALIGMKWGVLFCMKVPTASFCKVDANIQVACFDSVSSCVAQMADGS